MSFQSITVPVVPSGALTSAPLPINLLKFSAGVGLLLTISTGASLTATVQLTGDNVSATGYNPATGNWNAHDTISNVTSSTNGNLAFPVTAARLVVTNYVRGNATLSVVQADG